MWKVWKGGHTGTWDHGKVLSVGCAGENLDTFKTSQHIIHNTFWVRNMHIKNRSLFKLYERECGVNS